MECTDYDRHQVFAPFGEITSAIVIRDTDGQSRRFGFVNYRKTECAIEAIKILNATMVKDMALYVGKAQKKAERQAELKAKFEHERADKFKLFEGLELYIKNIEDSINDVHLRNLFENFGEIASCKVILSLFNANYFLLLGIMCHWLCCLHFCRLWLIHKEGAWVMALCHFEQLKLSIKP